MNEKYWIAWMKAAAIRAIKTMAQTAISVITIDAVGILDVNWIAVGSAAALAGVVSMLTSLAGLPEVDGFKEDGE